MRRPASFDSGIRARYLASTSLHSMPRGPDPRGASTVLVNLVPAVVTIVTVPPQLQVYFTGGGAGSTSTRSMSLVILESENLASLAWAQVKSLSATADAT